MADPGRSRPAATAQCRRASPAWLMPWRWYIRAKQTRTADRIATRLARLIGSLSDDGVDPLHRWRAAAAPAVAAASGNRRLLQSTFQRHTMPSQHAVQRDPRYPEFLRGQRDILAVTCQGGQQRRPFLV